MSLRRVLLRFFLPFVLLLGPTAAQPATQQQVADYVRDHVLGGSFGERSLWMTREPLDGTYVYRDWLDTPDVPFPSPGLWWLVTIDDHPAANWGHPCRTLFVSDDLAAATTPVDLLFPPTVFADGGAGAEAYFYCADVTPTACSDMGYPVAGLAMAPASPAPDNSCLHAILISGGVSKYRNKDRYRENLKNMYGKLRECGYPKANISTYYAAGLDGEDFPYLTPRNTWKGDLDGDGQNDLTGAANEQDIAAKIREECARLDPTRDVLFIYITNHGNPPTEGPGTRGACLWDRVGVGREGKSDDEEVITPAELYDWLKDCKACRVWVLGDFCYAGVFVEGPPPSLPPNVAVYVATSSSQPSEGSNYLDQWRQQSPATKSMNEMHQAVANIGSTPGTAEGSQHPGDGRLCDCCGTTPAAPPTWGRIKTLYR
jgi:hypothetical protein